MAVEDRADAGHLRHLPPSIRAWQALTSHIRHTHTEYDEMLKDGYDQDTARHFVFDEINENCLNGDLRKQFLKMNYNILDLTYHIKDASGKTEVSIECHKDF